MFWSNCSIDNLGSFLSPRRFISCCVIVAILCVGIKQAAIAQDGHRAVIVNTSGGMTISDTIGSQSYSNFTSFDSNSGSYHDMLAAVNGTNSFSIDATKTYIVHLRWIDASGLPNQIGRPSKVWIREDSFVESTTSGVDLNAISDDGMGDMSIETTSVFYGWQKMTSKGTKYTPKDVPLDGSDVVITRTIGMHTATGGHQYGELINTDIVGTYTVTPLDILKIYSDVEPTYRKDYDACGFMSRVQNMRNSDGSMNADTIVYFSGLEYLSDINLAFIQSLSNNYSQQWSLNGSGSVAFPLEDRWNLPSLHARLRFGANSQVFPSSSQLVVAVTDSGNSSIPVQTNTYTVNWHLAMENISHVQDLGQTRTQQSVQIVSGSGMSTTTTKVNWSVTPAWWGHAAGTIGAGLTAVTITPWWQWNLLAGIAGITLSMTSQIGSQSETVEFYGTWNAPCSTWSDTETKPDYYPYASYYHMEPKLNIVWQNDRWKGDFYDLNGYSGMDFTDTQVKAATWFSGNFHRYYTPPGQ